MQIAVVVRKILSSLAFLNIVKRYQGKSALMKIKAAQAYIVGVKKIRILFLAIVSIAVAFLFLASGLSLIHEGIFTYSLLSQQTKFILSLIIGGIEFLGAGSILYYLFREDIWMKFTEIPMILQSILEGQKKE